MSDNTLPAFGTTAVPTTALQKGIDLAVLKKGAKDYLEFMDATKEAFFAYLYHRTGSLKLAHTLLSEVHLSVLTRTMSLWSFGALSLRALLDMADKMIEGKPAEEADLDQVYLPTLTSLSDAERRDVSSLHDALWTLPKTAQRLLILSLFLGLSNERIGKVLFLSEKSVTEQLGVAHELLVSRWQPSSATLQKLTAVAFVPALDIASETNLRFMVVEKYNALRFRRYQWLIIGGVFAVLSNVIVASVLAFAVVVQPSTSLKQTRKEVASLDGIILQRQMKVAAAKRSITASFQESQRIVAYDVTRNFTVLGLGTALDALKAQQKDETQVDKIIQVLERAKTAMKPMIDIAMRDVRAILASGPETVIIR